MISILETEMRQEWDNRYWELAQKSDKPLESYQEMLRSLKDMESTEKVEDLPKEQQAWLRAR